MYAIDIETTIEADAATVWATWTDMDRYPDWDRREEITRLDGPFAVGTTGFSKQVGRRPGSPFRITLVEPMQRWVNECPLPGGRLVLDHYLQVLADGRLRLRKRCEVYGPLAVLFRVRYAKAIRVQVPEVFRALEAEAARREHAVGR